MEIVIELAFSAMSRGDGIDDSGLGVTLALGGVSGGAKTQFGIFLRRLRACSGGPRARANGDRRGNDARRYAAPWGKARSARSTCSKSSLKGNPLASRTYTRRTLTVIKAPILSNRSRIVPAVARARTVFGSARVRKRSSSK